VLAVSVYQQLGLLDTMKRTQDLLSPSSSTHESLPDGLVALKSAIAAIELTYEAQSSVHPVRFPFAQIRKWEASSETPDEYFERVR
jgi:hypothetical protein